MLARKQQCVGSWHSFSTCAAVQVDDQFSTGRLLACIASRPGQCGRVDGYILEGKELEFYQRRMQKRKGKQ